MCIRDSLGTVNDRYSQNGTNWALFTHNIFHITDKLDLTLGLRYTNDKKRFNASFTNDNTVCTTVQGLVLDDLLQPQDPNTTTDDTARALAGALIGLSFQGNSVSYPHLRASAPTNWVRSTVSKSSAARRARSAAAIRRRA